MKGVQIHNLSEERSVGLLNYELGYHGHHNFDSSAQNIVLNKSCDLLERCEDFRKYNRKIRFGMKKILTITPV